MPRTGPRASYRTVTVKDKFDRHWVGEPNCGCWLWIGSCRPNGYGEYSLGYGRTAVRMGAHRASYMLHVGEIPDGMLVCHKCDVKCCVNPSHLFLGSAVDAPRGERNSRSKLSVDAIKEIRASTEPTEVLAKRYGVSGVSMWKARTGRSWTHVP